MADSEQQLLEGQLQAEVAREELVAEETDKEAEESEIEQAAFEEEADYTNQLALEREQEAQATNALQEEGRSFVGPSLFKYLIIFLMFAIPNDIIDAIELIPSLSLLSSFISLFLSGATVIIVWFTDSELKRVKGHMAKRGEHQKVLAKTMAKTASKLMRFAPKNPVIKVVAGAVLEIIPYVSMLPWASISVYLAYSDERKAFKEAREASEDTSQFSSAQEPEMI